MAKIDNTFLAGIVKGAGFQLNAHKPLDSRTALNTLAERDALIADASYLGMMVYVAETDKTYIYKGEDEAGKGIWEVIATQAEDATQVKIETITESDISTLFPGLEDDEPSEEPEEPSQEEPSDDEEEEGDGENP